jgi:hypothetical protein
MGLRQRAKVFTPPDGGRSVSEAGRDPRDYAAACGSAVLSRAAGQYCVIPRGARLHFPSLPNGDGSPVNEQTGTKREQSEGEPQILTRQDEIPTVQPEAGSVTGEKAEGRFLTQGLSWRYLIERGA